MSSENIGLLCSSSMLQPWLNISVNVSLGDMLWIAEPYVTKRSIVIQHYKPECHVQKMGFYLQGQHHNSCVCLLCSYNEIMTTSIIFSKLLILLGDQLSLTVHSWSVLWKGCFAIVKVKVTVKVLNFSECLPGHYLWSVKLSIVMHHHQPEYHSEISFCDVQGQSHNHFY